MKSCNHCKKLFTPNRRNQIYCSQQCKITHNNDIGAIRRVNQTASIISTVTDKHKKRKQQLDMVISGYEASAKHLTPIGIEYLKGLKQARDIIFADCVFNKGGTCTHEMADDKTFCKSRNSTECYYFKQRED